MSDQSKPAPPASEAPTLSPNDVPTLRPTSDAPTLVPTQAPSRTEAPLAPADGHAATTGLDVRKATNAAAAISLTGQVWGDFEFGELLGKGGMGVVYRGRQISLDRPVALKVLPRELGEDEQFRERFLREARAVGRIVSEHVVQVYFAGVHDGQHFYAMEYVDGKDLQRRLKSGWRPSHREALDIVLQAARGLHAAGDLGLVHRDIKPGNLIMTGRGVVKLMDFGLVRLTSEQHSLTRTGVVMGTVSYFSPEQGRGERTDQRSDLYSLGVVLFELLTGKLPFVGESATSVIYQHIHETPRAPHEIDASVPAAYDAVVMRCLAKRPDLRYPSAGELIADLEAIAAGRGARSLARAATAMAVLALVVVAACVAFIRGERAATTKASTHSAVAAAPAVASTDAAATAVSSRPAVAPRDGAAIAPPPRVELAAVAPSPEPVVTAPAPSLAAPGPESRAPIATPAPQPIAAPTPVPEPAIVAAIATPEPAAPALAPIPVIATPTPPPEETAVAREVPEPPLAAPAPTPEPVAKPAPEPMPAEPTPAEPTAATPNPAPLTAEKPIGPVVPPGFTAAQQDAYGWYADLAVGPLQQRFRWCAPGEFRMGSPDDEHGRAKDELEHEVRLTHGFWLADTELTQAWWTAIAGDMPAKFRNPALPVDSVSRADCERFCDLLATRVPGLRPRLPTEAEWEFACRAGGIYAFGAADDLDRGDACIRGGKTSVRPRSYRPNAWGLYDMLGNVREWCADVYRPYPDAALTDPVLVGDGKGVVRGGCWDDSKADCRAAKREPTKPATRSPLVGMRLAVDAPRGP